MKIKKLKIMDNCCEYEKYYNSERKIYEFELKKDFDRNGKILKAGQKIPTTQEGIKWFLDNGYGEEKKTKNTKKDKASDKK